MMKYLDDNDKVRGAEAAQHSGQDGENVMLACHCCLFVCKIDL